MSVCFFVPSEQAGTSSAEDEPENEAGEIPDTAQQVITDFWAQINKDMEMLTPDHFKTQVLPLARIKKIMKLDEDVKMISGEAPVLFAKAAEIFIHEITLRAWIHTQDNKRRTLQRNDIAMAVSKSDMFDFLIDIIPRQDYKPPQKVKEEQPKTANTQNEPVQYYLQLAQQHQAALQPQQAASAQPIQILQPYTHSLLQQTASNQASSASNTSGHTILQQVVAPNGEIQQVPTPVRNYNYKNTSIQVSNPQQNLIRMINNGQSILIAQPSGQQAQLLQVSPQQQQQVFIPANTSQANTD